MRTISQFFFVFVAEFYELKLTETHVVPFTDHFKSFSMSKIDIQNFEENMEPDEEVSLGQMSDDEDDDGIAIGSITATTLAALSLHDSQRPRSALSGPRRVPGVSRRKRTCSTSASISTERETILRTSNRTIYTAGRPPWYNEEGQLMDAFVIGVCGGSASGKTTVAKKIIKSLNIDWVTLLSMDSFYKVLSEEQHQSAAKNEYNFDHPDAFDFALLVKTLKRLKAGKRVEVPIYNFVTHRRESKTTSMYGRWAFLQKIQYCSSYFLGSNKILTLTP